MLAEFRVKHRKVWGHPDEHGSCGKPLMRSVLERVAVRQHARPEPISKRAPSSASARLKSFASDGEMSRRSGFAAKADNHSDISPL